MSDSTELQTTQNSGTVQLICPRCGSDEVKNLSMIYGDHRNININLDYFIGLGFGIDLSKNLVKMCEPPKKKDTSGCALIFLGLLTLAFLFAFFPIGIVFGVLTYGAYKANAEAEEYNNNQYPIEYEEWRNSFICLKCGNKFVIR